MSVSQMLTSRRDVLASSQAWVGRAGIITLFPVFRMEITRNSASWPPCGDKGGGSDGEMSEIDANAVPMS